MALFFAGCKQQYGFGKTVIYDHPSAGFSVQVPASWEKVMEDKTSVAFYSYEHRVAFNILLEVGGLGYYDLEGLGEEVVKHFKQELEDVKVIEQSNSNVQPDTYRVILQGRVKSENGNGEIISKVFIIDYDPGIRYYLVFTAEADDYYGWDYEFEDLAKTFTVYKDKRDIYKLIQELGAKELPEGHPEISGDQREGD